MMETLRALAEQLNATPKDSIDDDWGTMGVSSNYIMTHLKHRVGQHKKLFRQKKLSYESGLVLYIYSYPSYHMYELIRKESLLRECRGIILSPLGVRTRPFPVIPTVNWSDIKHYDDSQFDITIKVNGIMFTGLQVRDKIYCINKGGKAIRIHDNYYGRVKRLVRDADVLGLTPIFELTDQDKPLVIRENTGCTLVGIRSIRTGRMARAFDTIDVADMYSLDKLVKIYMTDLLNLDKTIEGIVFNDGENIARAKTPEFKKLQKITSILRYGRKGDLKELVEQVGIELLKENLTTSELEIVTRRQ
jgi:hypothetical protein